MDRFHDTIQLANATRPVCVGVRRTVMVIRHGSVERATGSTCALISVGAAELEINECSGDDIKTLLRRGTGPSHTESMVAIVQRIRVIRG